MPGGAPWPSIFEKHAALASVPNANGPFPCCGAGHGTAVEPPGMISLVAWVRLRYWTRSGVT